MSENVAPLGSHAPLIPQKTVAMGADDAPLSPTPIHLLSERCAMRRDVVAEHGGFHLELSETEFHHVADRHDAANLSIVPDDEVSDSLVRHSPHDGFDTVVYIAEDGGSHDLLDEHAADRTKVTVHRLHDVSLADESDDAAVGRHDGHAADVVDEEQTDCLRDFFARPHGDDALTVDQISNTHCVPPNRIKGYS
jgi:hypothetical protein